MTTSLKGCITDVHCLFVCLSVSRKLRNVHALKWRFYLRPYICITILLASSQATSCGSCFTCSCLHFVTSGEWLKLVVLDVRCANYLATRNCIRYANKERRYAAHSPLICYCFRSTCTVYKALRPSLTSVSGSW